MGQKYAKTFKIVQDNAVTLRDLTWLTYDGLISKLDDIMLILVYITTDVIFSFHLVIHSALILVMYESIHTWVFAQNCHPQRNMYN